MALIYLLRHGETDWNAQKRLQGSEDIPLNANGRAQAQAMIPVIAALPIVAAYASDLSRAHETAQIVLSGHLTIETPMVEQGLRERNFGRMSGKTNAEVAIDKAAHPHLYHDHATRLFPRDGETPDGFATRIRETTVALIDRHTAPFLIVSHGGVIREIMRVFTGTTQPPQPGNCHLYLMQRQIDDWQIDRIWPQ